MIANKTVKYRHLAKDLADRMDALDSLLGTVEYPAYGCGVPYGVDPLVTRVYYTGADGQSNPIGGGDGYLDPSHPISAAPWISTDARHNGVYDASFVVSTITQLKAALAHATHSATVPGTDRIYVANSANCEITGATETLDIPAGVWLIGGRGTVGVTPGIISFAAALDSSKYEHLLDTAANVLISGLDIRGCSSETTGLMSSTGIAVGGANNRIRNCIIHNWGYAGIGAYATNGIVSHCYIHHNQKSGLGYGVDTSSSSGYAARPIYEGNIFATNRHHHAGQRGSGGNVGNNDPPTCTGAIADMTAWASFEFRYNYLGAASTNTQIDIHGQDGGQCQNVDYYAGDEWSVHHNTSIVGDTVPFCGVRGYPKTLGSIYNNWIYCTNVKLWNNAASAHMDCLTINEQLWLTWVPGTTGYFGYDAPYAGEFYHMNVHDNWYGIKEFPGLAAQSQLLTHHTANYTLTVEESGTTHTNLGASGHVILTLPEDAQAGIKFTFAVMYADNLSICVGVASKKFYANGTISTDDGGADMIITADDEGEAITLMADGNGHWFVTNMNGTWTVSQP